MHFAIVFVYPYLFQKDYAPVYISDTACMLDALSDIIEVGL